MKNKTIIKAVFSMITAFIISSKTFALPLFRVMFRKFMNIPKIVNFCKYAEKVVYFYLVYLERFY